MKRIQVVLDCRDAVALGLWWAETLGWEFEWLDEELFEHLRVEGHCTVDDVVRVDERLSWRDGAAISAGEGDAMQRIYFQSVPEPKTVKNRMHIDVRSDPEPVEECVARLETRGARRVGAGRQGPHAWIVMVDPEGNEFCVS
jgi:hypothetical protein